MNEKIIWYQLANESADERTARLNAELHRIFFDGKDVCPRGFKNFIGYCYTCLHCGVCFIDGDVEHGTPRFLESLDAMQLIVESGKFAEVREEYYHWLESGKPKYGCRILIYRQIGNQQMKRIMFFEGKGSSRQEAFYVTALRAMGYEVVQESQGESNV